MTLAELNARDRDGFVEAVGWVFEHSPWVAERAWARRPFATRRGPAWRDGRRKSRPAPPEEQLALLRAHPDLGARARDERGVGRRAGRRRARSADGWRARTAAAAERRLSREIRLPVSLRRERRHEARYSRSARAAPGLGPRRRAPGGAAARSPASPASGWTAFSPRNPRSHREPIRQRSETRLLRQGRRHRLPAEPDRAGARGRGRVRRECAPAGVRRGVLADLHHTATIRPSSRPTR